MANVSIQFTKKIPDSLYVNTFVSNSSLTLTYNGPESSLLLIEKDHGHICGVLETMEDAYNPDDYLVIETLASDSPDVLCYFHQSEFPEREYVTETLVDGTTHEEISNPTLKDYYRTFYDLENKIWVWEVITREPRSVYNDVVDRYREYVNQNLHKIESNESLKEVATKYLQRLTDFETTGAGSIPSWKIITANIASVPLPSPLLMTAFENTP
jgi:hypothetical protein